jgi:prepilin-type N-terminal cleavage/methylation domain-containing protein
VRAARERVAERGLTMVELVVALAIVVVAALIGFPLLQKTIVRANLEGAAEEMASALRQARLEAIRRSAPAIVVLDPATRRVTAFVDLNNANAATGYRGSDLLYNPEAAPALPDNAKDFLVVEAQLSPRVAAGGPPSDTAAIDGLTDRGAGPRLVFSPDGSVLDVGGFRLNDGVKDVAGDVRNVLEVRVSPASAARIQLRKWNVTDNAWYARDMRNGKSTWQWY